MQAWVHLAFGDNLIRPALRKVAGNRTGEAEADFIDADNFTTHVDQRAAGISAINRRIVPNPTNQPSDVLPIQLEMGEWPKETRHDHFGVADDAQRYGLGESHEAD